MIGLIQHVLVDLVKTAGGYAAVSELMTRAGLPVDHSFRLDTDYSDSQAIELIDHACDILGITRDQALEAYAEHFMTDARKRFPVFFEMSPTARDFLRRQSTIHNCLGAGLAEKRAGGALGDRFLVEATPDGLITHYRSPNRLARLYIALARAVLRLYNETAEITPLDDIDGESCRIRLSWPQAAAGA